MGGRRTTNYLPEALSIFKEGGKAAEVTDGCNTKHGDYGVSEINDLTNTGQFDSVHKISPLQELHLHYRPLELVIVNSYYSPFQN